MELKLNGYFFQNNNRGGYNAGDKTEQAAGDEKGQYNMVRRIALKGCLIKTKIKALQQIIMIFCGKENSISQQQVFAYICVCFFSGIFPKWTKS